MSTIREGLLTILYPFTFLYHTLEDLITSALSYTKTTATTVFHRRSDAEVFTDNILKIREKNDQISRELDKLYLFFFDFLDRFRDDMFENIGSRLEHKDRLVIESSLDKAKQNFKNQIYKGVDKAQELGCKAGDKFCEAKNFAK